MLASRPVREGVPEHGRVPKYFTVKARLVSRLAELGEGAPLPAERELAAEYAVSRATLRQAISELILEGRLSSQQGRGTFVAAPKLIQPLGLVSYTEAVRTMGREPSRRIVTAERVPATPVLAGVLGLAPDAEVIHLERVLLADGEPIGLESTYLSAGRFATLLDVLAPGASLYRCMREEFGVELAEAEEQIETVLASPREAALLGANPALPMLLVHRVSHDAAGTPVEQVRSLFRGDRIGFRTRLRG
ncbi:GntR family transcriptional regulator [Longispora fulva]|uniref:GntR family transcriptional regulator n=1 Tax=Longispora fulva TaxID=619741 RepID=A0A8J7KGR4_9ACTN|nr:GntR family transcriptional regulator [Longispora fulva]MBG6135199.1 GntR family transcriptional regulator [Longispora fulva]